MEVPASVQEQYEEVRRRMGSWNTHLCPPHPNSPYPHHWFVTVRKKKRPGVVSRAMGGPPKGGGVNAQAIVLTDDRQRLDRSIKVTRLSAACLMASKAGMSRAGRLVEEYDQLGGENYNSPFMS
jgi:hypothetical protein